MRDDRSTPAEYVEVLRTGDAAALPVIVSLLEGSAIRHRVFDVASWVFGESGVWPRVMVDREQLDEARELLQEFL